MKVLLYAPDLVGHPQVYCRTIADILLELGCNLVLAVGRTQPFEIGSWPDVNVFVGHEKVTFETCANPEGKYLSAEQIREIQSRHKIDATLFIEGDKSRDQFYRIGSGDASELYGRNYAIFARTTNWYPGEDFYSGQRTPFFAPTLRGNLGKLKRSLLQRKETDRYFYETLLMRNQVLDGILVKDERVAEHFGPPVHWMPEIFRPVDATEGEADRIEFELVSSRYHEFKERNSERTPVLFFGTGSWYRGYDFFLKLIEMDPDSCGIHGGGEYLCESGKEYLYDVMALRHKLRKEGRLFETNAYIGSQKLVDYLFAEISHGVSTHRLSASSGTVLQTLWAGNPVLVPDSGLLGYQNRKYGLGPTYSYGDQQSLVQVWSEFRSVNPALYLKKIELFCERFSRDNMVKFYSDLLLGHKLKN